MKTNQRFLVFVVGGALVAQNVWISQAVADSSVYQVRGTQKPRELKLSREIRQLDQGELQQELNQLGFETQDVVSDVDAVVTVFDKLWMIGEKIYPIVKKSEAVLDLKKPTWSVLPEGVTDSRELTHWQAPKYSAYEISYRNAYKMEVVKVRFVTQYAYGGKQDGRGAYLAHLTVVPSQLHVQIGFHLDTELQAKEALNMGSAEDPVAGFSFDVVNTVQSRMGSIRVSKFMDSVHYFMDGTGKLQVAR